MHTIFCFNKLNKGKNVGYWILISAAKNLEILKVQNLNRLKRSFEKEVGRMNIQFTEQNWADLTAAYHQ